MMLTRFSTLRLFQLILLLGIAGQTLAQTGTVTYVHTVQLDLDLPPEAQSYAKYMPESITTNYTMDFAEATSLTAVSIDESEMPSSENIIGSEGRVVRMMFRSVQSRMGASSPTTYVDVDEGSYVEQREFLDRTFLITGSLPEIAWKLSGEEGQLLGHHVMKATATIDSSMVEAWFTPEVPVSLGPDKFNGLPGLILMLSMDEGQQLFEATDIQLDTAPEIIPPKKGREVTQEEFEAIVAERMEERLKSSGQPNITIIRH